MDELRYRNVSLHSQGKTEHGTLHLLKHHVRFSYYPSAKEHDAAAGHSRTASTAAHHAPETDQSTRKGDDRPYDLQPSTQDRASEDRTAHMQSHSKPERTKVRPKELWIPYPMIGYCILRPSHAASNHTARPSDAFGPSQTRDDLFPPTFGTSEYGRQVIRGRGYAGCWVISNKSRTSHALTGWLYLRLSFQLAEIPQLSCPY